MHVTYTPHYDGGKVKDIKRALECRVLRKAVDLSLIMSRRAVLTSTQAAISTAL